jgi:FAD:protein FMN transferase
MGCPCALHIECTGVDEADAAMALSQVELQRLDRKYSHYRDDSIVADIAARAGSTEWTTIDAETAGLLDFAELMHAQSEGLFDISSGALTRLWDLQGGIIPDKSAIQQALAMCGWHRIEWARPRLRLPVPGMRLDLGGIVKEYAADRVAQLCRDAGIRHGMVDLGGDLAVIGAHADASPWRIGIRLPDDPERPAAHIDLAEGGLATSGDYARCMIVDGRRYGHIIDPRTGMPVDSFASVSVSAANCLVAGAAATTAMLLGKDAGSQWLDELGLPHVCLSRD